MTKAKVTKLAARLGVELTDDDELGRIFADAPKGKRFEPDLHCLVADYGSRGDIEAGWKAEAWADLAERLAYVEKHGLEDCDEKCPDYSSCRD